MKKTLVAALCLLIASPALAHPLHTSLAQVSIDPASHTIAVSLRVFADDFTAASSEWRSRNPKPATASPTSPILDYARAAFILRDEQGNQMILASCGARRVGDLMWLCFRGTGDVATVESRVLFDSYKDQINVVQSTVGGHTSNLLFTPGDKPKSLY